MKAIVDLLRKHFELGYVRQLLWVDYFLLFMFALDLSDYHINHGLALSTWAIWQVATTTVLASFQQVLVFTLFLLVIVPIVITFLRVIGWTGTFLKGRLAHTQYRVLCVHASICLLLAYLFCVATQMENLSGYAQRSNGAIHYSFQSLFALLVTSPILKVILGSTTTLVGVVATTVLSYVALGTQSSTTLKQYLLRASLADLPAEYRPVKTAGRFDVPNPSTLTRVDAVHIFAARVLREYQELGPGSSKATEYLDGRYSECIGTITDKLLIAPSNNASRLPVKINLFTGSKGAFEAALAQIPGRRKLIVSPYSSPSLTNLVRWFSLLSGDEFAAITFPVATYSQTWEEQQRIIITNLAQMSQDTNSTLVLVVSEVFFASGLRIPLETFIRNVGAAIPRNRIRFIVDGTNAVGNRRVVDLDADWDSYIFSPHKWLMATENCGVLLSRNETTTGGPDAPGIWKVGARKRDVQIRVLAGLRGAVELMRSPGLMYFAKRCNILRQQFKLRLPGIRLIGDLSGLEETFIFSCLPGGTNVWKLTGIEMESEIISRGLNASVLPLDPMVPWVRIAIPYFLDVREITRLCEFLDEVRAS
jgi:hypothetical protein